MKKLLILLSIILLSMTSYSQKMDSVICIPTDVAKKIALDLVSGDSAKALLSMSESKITSLENKVGAQALVIQNSARIEANLVWQLGNEKAIRKDYMDLYDRKCSAYNSLQKKYKWTKFKSNIKSAVGVPVVLALTALYILK